MRRAMMTTVAVAWVAGSVLASGAWAQQSVRRSSGSGAVRSAPPPMPPAVEIPKVDPGPLAEARKELVAAKAKVTSSTGELAVIRRKLEAEADGKPDVKAALAVVEASRAALDAASAPVISLLAGKPEYQAAVNASNAANAKVAEVQKDEKALPEVRTTAAMHALGARNAVSKLQNDALAADSGVATAREKYQADVAALAALRKTYGDFEANPEFAAAKAAVAEAKTTVADATTKVDEAQKAFAKQQTARNEAVEKQKKDRAAAAANGPADTGLEGLNLGNLPRAR